jgi:hypothetical protein
MLRCDNLLAIPIQAMTPVVCMVPIRDGGETRERPFARNPENTGAAIRYALVIF